MKVIVPSSKIDLKSTVDHLSIKPFPMLYELAFFGLRGGGVRYKILYHEQVLNEEIEHAFTSARPEIAVQ